jgi:DNA-binding NarL/FixJ family response regulator
MNEKIIIADDHPVFRDGMTRLVGSALPDASLFEAATMAEVLDAVEIHGAPDLFILDLLFPGMNPRETIPALRQQCRKSSIMIVSMLDDETTIDRIMAYGADGYVVKSNPAPEMLAAIMSVRSGNFVIARPNLVATTDIIPGPADVMDLTQRQREILYLISEGQSNKAIGRKLHLSPFTVRNHVSLLFRMLKVRSRVELAAKADRLGYQSCEKQVLDATTLEQH